MFHLLLVFALLLFAPFSSVLAGPVVQVEPVTLDALVKLLGSLGGVAALITVLINILKKAGVVKDGTSQTWSTGLNILALVLLFVAKAFFPQIDIPNIDAVLGSVASILTLLLGLVFQLFVSKTAHGTLRGFPLIGYSHSRSFAAQLHRVDF